MTALARLETFSWQGWSHDAAIRVARQPAGPQPASLPGRSCLVQRRHSEGLADRGPVRQRYAMRRHPGRARGSRVARGRHTQETVMKNFSRLPQHIGIIPDGNRRWAQHKGLKKQDGHESGLRPGLELYELCLEPVSYTHLRAHETDSYLVCRLLLEKKKKNIII